jgi:hypothetical protein
MSFQNKEERSSSYFIAKWKTCGVKELNTENCTRNEGSGKVWMKAGGYRKLKEIKRRLEKRKFLLCLWEEDGSIQHHGSVCGNVDMGRNISMK